MVYIFTEDSGSGFDFISPIIKRVIKPKTCYRSIIYQCVEHLSSLQHYC